MFYGRETQLKMIHEKLDSKHFEFMVIYGRRRVGKTALLRHALKDKNAIFFVANKEPELLALQRLSTLIIQIQPALKPLMTKFESWDTALEFILQNNLTLVIDEFPYLASSYSRILSLLQNMIDTHHDTSKTKLILCGSSMSFMERQLLGYESPLYGRRTAQLKLKPFTFFEARPFYEHFSKEEQFMAYSVFGGIPYYLTHLPRHSCLRDAIIDLVLSPIGHLYEEPTNLLMQELRDPTQYNSILDAIASGSSKHNEISTKTQMDSAKCSKYLKTLIDLHIIQKSYPERKEKKHSSVYSILDPLFNFWYRYVPKYRTHIELGNAEYLYDEIIQKEFSTFMGAAFENICKQYLERHLISNRYAWKLTNVKRWWGTNPLLKRQEEIDLVGWGDHAVLFCECKWRNEQTDIAVYKDLMRKSLLLSENPQYFMIFSKSGFTDGLMSQESSNLFLIDLDKLLES